MNIMDGFVDGSNTSSAELFTVTFTTMESVSAAGNRNVRRIKMKFNIFIWIVLIITGIFIFVISIKDDDTTDEFDPDED